MTQLNPYLHFDGNCREAMIGLYEDLTDKYGINWMFNYEKPKA